MLEKFLIKKNYISNLLWLTRDSLFRYKWRVLLIVLAGIIGMAIQALTFLTFVLFIESLDSGSSEFVLGSITFHISQTGLFDLLISISGFMLTLLVVSELSIFFSQKCALDSSRTYSDFCSNRVLRRIGSNAVYNWTKDKDGLSSAKVFLRGGMKDARLCGIAYRKILASVVPSLTFIVAFAILLFMNITLTSLLFLSLIFYLFIQIAVSKKATGFSVLSERRMPKARSLYSSWVSYFKNYSISEFYNVGDLNRLYSSGPIKLSSDAYISRIKIISYSRVITGVFSSFLFVILFLIILLDSYEDGIDWKVILLYLVALRFCLVNLKTVFVQITSINRVYYGVSRYIRLIKSFDYPKRQQREGKTSDDCILKLENPVLSSSENKLTVNRGECVALVSTVDISRYTIGVLIKSIQGVLNDEYSFGKFISFVRLQSDAPQIPFKELMDIASRPAFQANVHVNALRLFLCSFDCKNAKLLLPNNEWKKLSLELKFIISFFNAIKSDPLYLVFYAKELVGVEELFKVLVATQSEAVCLIVHEYGSDLLGKVNEILVVALDDTIVFGMGSLRWYESVSEEIKKHLNIVISEDMKTDVIDDSDEEFQD